MLFEWYCLSLNLENESDFIMDLVLDKKSDSILHQKKFNLLYKNRFHSRCFLRIFKTRIQSSFCLKSFKSKSVCKETYKFESIPDPNIILQITTLYTNSAAQQLLFKPKELDTKQKRSREKNQFYQRAFFLIQCGFDFKEKGF